MVLALGHLCLSKAAKNVLIVITSTGTKNNYFFYENLKFQIKIMLLFFWFFVFVKSFEEKSFDLDLTDVVQNLEIGKSTRIRRSFLHGSITTGFCGTN